MDPVKERVGRMLRTARSYLPRKGTAEEKVNFALFSNSESEKELSTLQNGSIRKSSWPDDRSQSGSVVDELSDFNVNPKDKISEWQAGWNVTNAIQGMFIVSFPYAVVQGGYWALVAMIVVAYICCHTGKILVHCLYEENEQGIKVRVRNSYVEIAEHVWGKRFGGRIVNCAQIIELLMTCILYVLLCGDLIKGSFPDSPLDLTSWIIISTVPLLACAFLQSLQRVSMLSFWCTVAHMLINAIILIYCFTKVTEWHWTDVQVRINIWTFPISLGIVVFSYTSQIFLPTLEGNLNDRSKFTCMMHWTHVAAAVFKAGFSYVGFLTWGFATKEVISNNLPTQVFKIIINIILVIKAQLSYPLPYFAAVDLLETALFVGRPETVFPACIDNTHRLKFWALFCRLALVLLTTALAIFIPHFAILMGLIGSFTGTMLSFVWPCYFHLWIRWHSMSRLSRALDIIIIIIGLSCGSIGIYYSGHALTRAFQGLPPSPFHG
ncbi:vesicular inhibitory amino acid transporter [Patella vulgata]|uniref:vesicular inhibitory amino acid transporter n=1 Tax=Patella vulgata TaxID=6465 RepID=UPI00218053C3|nr:vesicular inhibitory amino acid transporter [Patella vulgata]